MFKRFSVRLFPKNIQKLSREWSLSGFIRHTTLKLFNSNIAFNSIIDDSTEIPGCIWYFQESFWLYKRVEIYSYFIRGYTLNIFSGFWSIRYLWDGEWLIFLLREPFGILALKKPNGWRNNEFEQPVTYTDVSS